MMRLALAALLAAAVSAPAASASATKTPRVNWTESKQLPGDKGSLVFHVSKIVIAPSSWHVTAKVINRSNTEIVVSKGQPFGNEAGFGLGYSAGVKYGFSAINAMLLSSAHPGIPGRLGPGKSWAGTFSGYGVLPKDRVIWVTFGRFATMTDPTQPFSWITTHGFKS